MKAARSASGKHRSGATESGPTTPQVIGVAGVFALALMTVLLAVGVAARSGADRVRARAQVEGGDIGLELVASRPSSHRAELAASRFTAEQRAYAQTALRVAELGSLAAGADEAAVAALEAEDRQGAAQAAADSDRARRELADALQTLREVRARLAQVRTELANLGSAPPLPAPAPPADS